MKVPVRFRSDLKVNSRINGENGRLYTIVDPHTGHAYSFGPEEYFLCQSMDGTATPGEIRSRFASEFGGEISEASLIAFGSRLREMGLAEEAPAVPAKMTAGGEPSTAGSALAGAEAQEPKPASGIRWASRFSGDIRYVLLDPEAILKVLVRLTAPFALLFKCLMWSLVLAGPAAIYLIYRHSDDFYATLKSSREFNYLGRLLFGLLTINLLRCAVSGVVAVGHGIRVSEFGIHLRRGILPTFYEKKEGVRAAPRSLQLLIYGMGLIICIFCVVAGTFGWYLFKSDGGSLASYAVIIAQAGLFSFFIQLLPLETTSGYLWLMTALNLPINLIALAMQVLVSRFTGRPLPDTLSGARGTRYLVYAVCLLVAWGWFFIEAVRTVAEGLESTFPGIFGRATLYVFGGLLAVLVARWFLGRASKHSSKLRLGSEIDDDDADAAVPSEISSERGVAAAEHPPLSSTLLSYYRKHPKLCIAAAVLLLMLVPFPYRPGGEIQVLPPVQQQIQAPVSGKVAEVLFQGGDGALIRRGTVIAKMSSSDLENQILTLEQSRAEQAATVQRLQSELDKLLAGARSQEITGAEAKLNRTIDEISAAQRELDAAKVSMEFSAMVLPRMKKLYESGSVAYLQYEEAKKTADLDRITVQRSEKQLSALGKTRDEAQAELDLLRAGSRPEDVQAARHGVEAAQADLARINQQIQYANDQKTETALLMPHDGYLVDSHLEFKKGIYLEVGEVFAVSQNNTQPLVEVQLPEYDIEGVAVGTSATIKLFAYPNTPLSGKVLSIQPAADPSATTDSDLTARMFRILIEVPHPSIELKAGMTGFAKVSAGVQPLGLLLTRPLVRFVQIELWSWLP